jgi:hypothetical protein
MNATRATPEQLEACIVKLTGSSGGCQWSFQLPCKFCRHLGTVSAKRHSISDPKALRKAAEKFAEQGWWFDGVPICCSGVSQPKCTLN